MRVLIAGLCLVLAGCSQPRFLSMPGSTTNVAMVLDSTTGDVYLIQASIPEPIVIKFATTNLATAPGSDALRDRLTKIAEQQRAAAAAQQAQPQPQAPVAVPPPAETVAPAARKR